MSTHYRHARFLAVLLLITVTLAVSGTPAIPTLAAPEALDTDTEADRVIGQADFLTRLNPTPPTGASMNVPKGVAVSGSATPFAFVSDFDNNRVMVFPLPAQPAFPDLTNGQATTVCLGQTGCTTSTPGASQTTLNKPAGVAIDRAVLNLYVADSGNNRVLRFTAPFASGMLASLVLGQVGYIGTTGGAGQGQLSNPQGVAVDASGTVYVADSGNNRVQIFRPTPSALSNGMSASASLGGTQGTGATQMNNPAGVAVGPDGKLYVADTGNNRVLVFTPPFNTGNAASAVFGQTTFDSGAPGTSQTTFRGPTGVALDVNNNLYVADQGNHRILQFNQNATDSDTSADRVFGQASFTSAVVAAPSSLTLNEPTAVAVHPGVRDTTNNFRDLFVADSNNHRVLQYWTPVPNSQPVINTPSATAFAPFPGETVPPSTNYKLFINGRDFADGATVSWDGLQITTPNTVTVRSANLIEVELTPANAALLRAIPDTDIPIVVTNPKAQRFPPPATPGIASAPVSYAICLPRPTIGGFIPTTEVAGIAGFELVITGTNFINTAALPLKVTWRGEPLTVTGLVTSTTVSTLTTFVAATATITPGAVPVVVSNFSDGPPCDSAVVSAAKNFTLTVPTPIITGFKPASAPVGTQPFTLTVVGTGFVPGAVVNWDGEARNTTFLNNGELVIDVESGDIPPAGSQPVDVPVTVTNPPNPGEPSGPTSGPLPFKFVPNNVPRIIELIPDRIQAGTPAFLLTVRGANFGIGAVVKWGNNTPQILTKTANEIVVVIPPEYIVDPGSVQVIVDDPTDALPASEPATFQVLSPQAAITSLSPISALVGGASFELTITGSGFINDSEARWDNTPLTRTSLASDGTQMKVQVPAALLATAGTRLISVNNPGGGSDSRPFEVVASNGPQIISFTPATAQEDGPSFTLVISGANFSSPTVQWLDGAILRSAIVQSSTATEVRAQVSSSWITDPKTVQITVVNAGGTRSNTGSFTITPRVTVPCPPGRICIYLPGLQK